MLYTVNFEEVSQSEFTRALRKVTKSHAIENSFFSECDGFLITEYNDGSRLETSQNSRELIASS
jgi:hypothetical protein